MTYDELYASSPISALTGSETLAVQQAGTSKGLTVDHIQAYFKATAARVVTDSTTLIAEDAFKNVEVNAGTAKTVSIPLDNSVNFKIGTQIKIIQIGAGQVTIGGSGITFRSADAATKTRVQYSIAVVEKRAANEWFIAGDITT
jgi:hypothetical protein